MSAAASRRCASAIAGAHQAVLLVAEAPALAGVRVQPGDRHPRAGDAEAVAQGARRQQRRPTRCAADGQLRGNISASARWMVARVTRSLGPASIMANSLHPGGVGQELGVPGELEPGAPGPFLRYGRGDQAAGLSLQHRPGRRLQVGHLRPAAVLAGRPGTTSSGAKPVTARPGRGRRRARPRPRRARQHARITEHQRRHRRAAAPAPAPPPRARCRPDHQARSPRGGGSSWSRAGCIIHGGAPTGRSGGGGNGALTASTAGAVQG